MFLFLALIFMVYFHIKFLTGGASKSQLVLVVRSWSELGLRSGSRARVELLCKSEGGVYEGMLERASKLY